MFRRWFSFPDSLGKGKALEQCFLAGSSGKAADRSLRMWQGALHEASSSCGGSSTPQPAPQGRGAGKQEVTTSALPCHQALGTLCGPGQVRGRMMYCSSLCSPGASDLLEHTGKWAYNPQGVTCTHLDMWGGWGGWGSCVIVGEGKRPGERKHKWLCQMPMRTQNWETRPKLSIVHLSAVLPGAFL